MSALDGDILNRKTCRTRVKEQIDRRFMLAVCNYLAVLLRFLCCFSCRRRNVFFCIFLTFLTFCLAYFRAVCDAVDAPFCWFISDEVFQLLFRIVHLNCNVFGRP